MKKLLSTLLALTMIFACVTPAFAADDEDDGNGDGVRVTHFFTEQDHTDENYGDLEYEYIDPAPIKAEAEAIRALLNDENNAEEVKTRFLAFRESIDKVAANYRLINFKYYHDTSDEEAFEEMSKTYDDYNRLLDVYAALLRDILLSPCNGPVRAMMIDADIAYYTAYEEATEEDFAADQEGLRLENEFTQIDNDPTRWSGTFHGEDWDYEKVIAAYQSGEISGNTIYFILAAIEAQTVAPLYLRVVDYYNAQAKKSGYDNAVEYWYAYYHDFSPEEGAAYREAIKEYLLPEYTNFVKWTVSTDTSKLPADVVYDGDGVFDTLKPYFGDMSSELLESMNYIAEHGSYDIAPAEHKYGGAFSANIPYYNMPFYYNGQNTEGYNCLLTTIHELGHNNRTYWTSHNWNDPDQASYFDTAEVHSQALEMLMTHYYSSLFGSQASIVKDNKMEEIIDGGILNGAMVDEFECWAFSTPNLTAEDLVAKAGEIAASYLPEGVYVDGYVEYVGNWMLSIHHMYESPFYYLAYSVSAAAAMSFWEEAQHDFYGAVDHYLQYSALPKEVTFQESFETIGMESPVSADYVKKLAETIHNYLVVPQTVGSFEDVKTSEWYATAVRYCFRNGIMGGTSDTTFSPNGISNREQAMTILARAFNWLAEGDETYGLAEGVAWATENGISDGTNPSGTLTREQFAVMLYKFNNAYELGLDETDDLSAFSDVDSISDWALEAIQWAVGNGLLQGSDGQINPQGTLHRSELATFTQRFMRTAYAALLAAAEEAA